MTEKLPTEKLPNKEKLSKLRKDVQSLMNLSAVVNSLKKRGYNDTRIKKRLEKIFRPRS